jgi:glycosyltransferase involved in cell wall biosynthesis
MTSPSDQEKSRSARLTPLVSVIIPAYNCDRYITQTVESILAQTYQHYEIIVIDDGSTDKTYQVLAPYFNQIHYVYQENQGVAKARNHGLKIAKGELIAFLDHDDIFLPEKLARQVECFQQYPDVAMVHSGWRRINAIAEFIADVEPWHRVPELNLENWLQWMPVLLSAMMFRREKLLKIGGLNPEFKQACDVDLVLRLALNGCQTCWVEQVLVCYREHENNDSLNTLIQAQECEGVRDQFFSRSDLPDTIAQIKPHSYYRTFVWIAWRLYYTNHLDEMVNYLEKSLQYTPYSVTKTISDWIQSLIQYASDYGYPFEAYRLIQAPAWQRLINQLIC